MESCLRSSTRSDVGFSLLPTELIHHIILSLPLPEVVRLKSVNKFMEATVLEESFVRHYNARSNSSTWLFIYKKKWRRQSMLHGFTDRSDRWFQISIAQILNPLVDNGGDIYFLSALGSYFLFALNNTKEVISVNIATRTVKRLPQSPLGPRGTSSWRRSGMKLLPCRSGKSGFRFLFAELHENRPVLFEYSSETDTWRATEGREIAGNLPGGREGGKGRVIFLSAANGRAESIMVAVESQGGPPVVVRPRFDPEGSEEGQLADGFSWGNATDRLHVYGDGNMAVVRSDGADDGRARGRELKGVGLYRLSSNGRQWEFVSRAPSELMEKVKKPHGAMMGCLEEREGTIRLILMSNFEGTWNIIWLCYDKERRQWAWVPLPDCNTKDSNMAGITLSSNLTL